MPQGAPTSPIISNLIFNIVDIRILRLTKKYKLDYTRYADDLSFSTNNRIFEEKYIHFLEELTNLLENSGFKINKEKTRLQYNSSRQEVTGLTTKTKQTVEMMEEVGQVVEEQSEKVEDTRSQFDVISRQLDNTKKSVERLNESGKELESTKDKLQEIIENLSALSQENAASAEESSATVEKQTASSQEIASASANLADMAQEMSEMISKFKI